LVELITGVLFIGTYLTFMGDWVALILALTFLSLLILVAVYDLRHLVIPDELVGLLTVVAMIQSGVALWGSRDPMTFALDIGAATLGSLFFFLLWQMSKGKWIGFGDVKLAFPLGLMLGCAGVFSMIVLSFWVGAAVGLFLLALQWLGRRGQRPLRFLRRTLTMKSALPFAPFLISGFLLVWLWGVNVIAILTYGA
jgi:leader peptidase (prepilin peptidase)/N-methyltransferase